MSTVSNTVTRCNNKYIYIDCIAKLLLRSANIRFKSSTELSQQQQCPHISFAFSAYDLWSLSVDFIPSKHARNLDAQISQELQLGHTVVWVAFKAPQMERRTFRGSHRCGRFSGILLEGYKARALAWACSRAAVSVWEPCMAMESAVRPRCSKTGEKNTKLGPKHK